MKFLNSEADVPVNFPLSGVKQDYCSRKYAITSVFNDYEATFWNVHYSTKNTDVGFGAFSSASVFYHLNDGVMIGSVGSGAGVLTSVICPVVNVANTRVTITVMADSKKHVFKKTVTNPSYRLLLGAFANVQAQDRFDSTLNTSVGGGMDEGFNYSAKKMLMLPAQALTETTIGIPFKKSMSVKIHMSVAPSNSGYLRNSVAVYSLGAES